MANETDTPFKEGQEATRDAARDIQAKVSEMADAAREKASGLGRKATERMDQTREATASRLERAGGALHNQADKVSSATHATARKVEAMGSYLREHTVGDIASEVRDVMVRNPGKTIGIALAAGFLIGHALKPGHDYEEQS